MAKTRITIEVEDEDVREIMRRFGLRTKTDAVALALSRLANRPMTLEEALAMQGAHAIVEVPEDFGPHGIDDRRAPR